MEIESSSTYRSMRSPVLEEDTKSERTNIQKSFRKITINLLERYHDQSYIVREKQPNNIQKYANFLNRITKLFYSQEYLSSLKNGQNLTFNPQDNSLYFWNVLVVLSIIYHFFQIPIGLFFTEGAFHSQFRSGFGISCNVISLVVLLINMVYVIPNTQYFHNGFLVTKHQKIVRRYVGWRLLIDALAYVSIFVFAVSNQPSLIYLKVVFYLMGYRLVKVDDSLQRKIELTKVRLAAYKLLRIILLMLFLNIWLASIFFAIDYSYYLEGENATYSGSQLWLTSSTATNSIDIIQYYEHWYIWLDYAIYWSLQTVSMVGFGDLTPKNPVEVAFTSIVITCVVVSFAFFITGVWQIIAQAREFKEYQNRQWKVYKEYQKQNMRPLDRSKEASQKGMKYRELKNKVGSYLFQMWNNQKTSSDINIVEVLQKSLTPELKDEVFINYRKRLFERIDLFHQLAEAEAKSYRYIFRELVFKISEKKYAKKELILKPGQINSNLIYLVNGKVTIKYPNSNYKRTFSRNLSAQKGRMNDSIDKNMNFGVKQFFTRQSMPYSVVSESFCKTSELSMDDFIKMIKPVHQFYIKYCELRDQIILYRTDYLSGQQCIECGSREHDLSECQKSDITFSYKKHWIKVTTMNKLEKPQSKQKCSKIPMRRKLIRSTKIRNIIFARSREMQIDKVKSYKFYNPQHNLSIC